jgi:hypothetical protein
MTFLIHLIPLLYSSRWKKQGRNFSLIDSGFCGVNCSRVAKPVRRIEPTLNPINSYFNTGDHGCKLKRVFIPTV